jgi:hypothetical protein
MICGSFAPLRFFALLSQSGVYTDWMKSVTDYLTDRIEGDVWGAALLRFAAHMPRKERNTKENLVAERHGCG